MGWWGEESDANDDTYDFLGIGIPERFQGTDAINESDRPAATAAFAETLNRLAAELEVDAKDERFRRRVGFVGVTRVALLKRVRVSGEHLELGLRYARELLNDPEHVDCFCDPEGRRKCLRAEIAMMEDAQANDGITQTGEQSRSLMDRIGDTLGASE